MDKKSYLGLSVINDVIKICNVDQDNAEKDFGDKRDILDFGVVKRDIRAT
ncbi:unnamed protein product [Meloidogyne enterolobii]|uniref:Uncharacterized protein n=1 Tax=Meloidogyne enterolobii TaxID=390850 RepID=A0ACB0YJW5_MELEN